MPQTKPMVSIENVVASATVDQKIDLVDITKKFPDTEYHPDQFPGLVFRIKSPKTEHSSLERVKWSVQVQNQKKWPKMQ